jgi:hypothetical protein
MKRCSTTDAFFETPAAGTIDELFGETNAA